MKRRKRPDAPQDIPSKANRVLNIVLIGIMLITLRVWHLAVIQHEEKLEESRRPQKRVVVEPAKRGTIRDRYNIPLAINKIKYQAAVIYSQIRQIPSIKWELEEGKRVKHYKRKEYIHELAQLIGIELSLDADRIEDLIHSKASLYNNLPYVLKEDITEQQYYRLKMLEKDWVGIHAQSLPLRHYPLGKVAGDIIGYTGAISREEYEGIVHEIQMLDEILKEADGQWDPSFPPGIDNVEQAQARLRDLTEHAYRANDHVGKTGIESKFEGNLRGYVGRKSYYTDARGNFLKQFPDFSPALSGQRLLLTISAELQQFAEELLIQNESIRIPRVTGLADSDCKTLALKHPWIKGGAIVAMDPNNGDVLAMASNPRFDPNDFIATGNPDFSLLKNSNIRRWFETEDYIGEIWDQQRPLEREVYDLINETVREEGVLLGWDKYLEFILPENSPILQGLKKVKSVADAIKIQKLTEKLYALLNQGTLYPLFNLIYPEPSHIPYGPRLPAVQQEDLEERVLQDHAMINKIQTVLDPYFSKIPSNYEKVLLIDLCRLVVDSRKVAEELYPVLEKMNLADYRKCNGSWNILETASKRMVKDLFREVSFRPWREQNQKAFLKEMREREKAAGIKYPKPYLDLLDKKEEEMFAAFWQSNRWSLIQAFLTGKATDCQESLQAYFNYFIAWHQELAKGAHKALEWNSAYAHLQSVFFGITEKQSVALMHSFRMFQDLNRPLYGKYRHLRNMDGFQSEKHLASGFYPAHGYGYGRSQAYRQAATQGSIFKIVTAYEAFVQKYNRIANQQKTVSNLNPFTIVDDTHNKGKAIFVGYDLEGKSIPQLYKGGRIPRSHRSGMGKVDFLKAFELSSNPYFALLTVECLASPNDLIAAAKKFGLGTRTGIDLPVEISGRVPDDLDCNRNGLYAMAIGQHSLVVTPLQTAVMLSAIANGGQILKPKIVDMAIGKEGVHQFPKQIKNEIFLPIEIRDILLEAMYRVSKKTQKASWGSLAQIYEDYPGAISDLIDLKDDLVGKSSTAESVENIDLDLKLGTNIYNHTWFGGIVYQTPTEDSHRHVFYDRFGHPELVVIVYLRYGSWGKDTVPVAAQVAQKWREIKRNH